MTANVKARATGVLLILLAIAAATYTWTFDIAFLADPLGPRAAPLLMSAVLGLAGAVLTVRPSADASWPDRRAGSRITVAVAMLVGYAIMLDLFGFVFATTALITGLALALGGPPVGALLAGAAFSGATYYLFVFALDVPLPIGRLFPFLGG